MYGQGESVRGAERSDELRERVNRILALNVDTSERNVAATKTKTTGIPNAINTSSFVTRFARHRALTTTSVSPASRRTSSGTSRCTKRTQGLVVFVNK